MENLTNLAEQFAEELKRERNAANLTQAELAHLLGVSYRAVQTWESGRSFPRAVHRRRIAEFFDGREAA